MRYLIIQGSEKPPQEGAKTAHFCTQGLREKAKEFHEAGSEIYSRN
jgi:hypothetical protein